MNRVIAFASLLFVAFAPSARAGISYDFASVTTGMAAQSLQGRVQADGARLRIDMTAGDKLFFQPGSVILSDDNGRLLTVADPHTRTYYLLDAANLLGSASNALRQLGGLVDVTVRNAKVRTRERGSGGTLQGYPTRRTAIDSSCELAINAFGQKTVIPISTHTEVWSTARLPASLAGMLQLQGVRTGIEEIDKILAAPTGGVTGFPLKQVTTTRISLKGSATTSTTTTTIRGIRQVNFAPSIFVMPGGYTQTASPIEKLIPK